MKGGDDNVEIGAQMPECDIITVGANSVHPKRQMVFDDTKISTKKSDKFNY